MARLTIHAGAPVDRLLEGFEENRSGRINSVADRYLELTTAEASRAGLTVAEWAVIFDAMSGACVETHGGPDWRLGWASVADSDEAGREHGVDVAALADKLRRMGEAGRIAVWEMAARYSGVEHGDPAAFLAEWNVSTREDA